MPSDAQTKVKCPDCYQCQMCSKSRCSLCKGGCQKKGGSELGTCFTYRQYLEWKEKKEIAEAPV